MVCLVIGVLSSIAMSSVRKAKDGAQRARTAVEVNTLRTEIEQYDLLNGNLPATLAELGRADMVDPWGNPYVYTVAGPGTGRELDAIELPTSPQTKVGFCVSILASIPGPGGKRAVASVCSTEQEDIKRVNANGRIKGG